MFLGTVVLYLDKGYKLNIENNSIYDRCDEYCIFVKSKKFSDRMRYVFEIRFVKEKEDALKLASQLYRDLRNFLISKDIPIYYNNKGFGSYVNEMSYYPAITTDYGKKNIHCLSRDLIGKCFDDEVIGYNVYQLITPIDDFRFITHEVNIELGQEFNKDVVEECAPKSDKELLALEIYNLSNSNLDIRVAFVLAITSIEVLVGEVVYKPDKYRQLIKQINKKVLKKNYIIDLISEQSNEAEEVIEYVKNSVGMLGKLSVLEKCKSLVKENFDDSDFYNGETALQFFEECYELRSKFIHAGNYDYKRIYDRKLALRKVCKKLLSLA
ncbi:hypothetical protein RBH29_11350 [Herbivorax sp. ANBcel31]|uniref:hypothetical protein n=1 Tax=Herbivorax sp. ANBcel31 TaxID=3069754 RepID=UPI0027B73848|nr:hypothetical protein [Herbivorax sp. ANBcel31]MDQ2087023.1 hypothetical protein [Herbivorax sp. ANBcel31]